MALCPRWNDHTSLQVPCNWDLLVWSWNWNICPRPYFQYDSGEIWLEECHEAGAESMCLFFKLKGLLCIGPTHVLVVLAFWLEPQCYLWPTLGVRPTQKTASITMGRSPRRRRQTKFGDFYVLLGQNLASSTGLNNYFLFLLSDFLCFMSIFIAYVHLPIFVEVKHNNITRKLLKIQS